MLCLLLFAFPPQQYSFYPECPLLRTLHVRCPGCGATRALAALLHGRLNEALHWNAFFVLLLPPGLAYAAVSYRRALTANVFRWPALPVPVGYALCGAAVAFALLRA